MEHRVLVLGTTFMFIGLAGCASGPSWHYDTPNVGDFFSYGGTDGSTLVVTVEGSGVRRDGYMAQHDSVLLRYELRVANASHPTWIFHEAIDRRTGLIVQQSSDCGFWVVEGGAISCYDERQLLVFGAQSLPGAFGSGAFWGRAHHGQAALRATFDAAIDERLREVVYHIEEGHQTGRRCSEIRADVPPDVAPRALPMSVIGGPLTLCEGVPLPLRFVTGVPATSRMSNQSLVTYSLLDWQRGAGDQVAQVVGGFTSVRPASPIPKVNLSAPFYLASPSDPFPFTTAEAHQIALEEVSAYRALFERDSTTVLFASLFGVTGWELDPMLNTINSTTYRRTIEAVSDSGNLVRVGLEKTVDEGSLTFLKENPSYEVVDVSAHVASVFPTAETIVRAQADLQAALTLAEQLTGRSFQGDAASFTHFSRGHSWMGGYSDFNAPALRQDGYELVFQLPEVQPEGAGGLAVTFSHQVIFDGPTGSIIRLDMPAERMPF